MKKQLLITSLVVLLMIIGTIGFILYGKGYRLQIGNSGLDVAGTGLLVATSFPDGAQVFINDHLTTATDNTINLVPGEYRVRIYKEGYFPWEKTIKVEKEVVAKAEALLFPSAPSVENLTTSGVWNPVLDPSQTRIAYSVASQSAKKNGVFVFDMSARPVLTLQSSSTQLTDDTSDLFSNAKLVWSPDGKELFATISATLRGPTTYLLKANGINNNPQDVTQTLKSIENLWTKQKEEKEIARLASLKSPLRKLIRENFDILAWSPDETKILYTASTSANLSLVITPRLIGVNTTPEERLIEEEKTYVYDIKEDKNYRITSAIIAEPIDISQGNSPLTWFPDSKHLIAVGNGKINILEYDGSNETTIYAGPFIDNYVFPWPNASKIVVLTQLGNTNIPPNLYAISLK